ncbi:DNA binding cold shock protein [Alkalihalophilus pseudofirmus OF4]|uniref:DNA binding cold shock protein n=1 Tax=Alkalihalophilus pseudofirmus (strain ATCC BAA-2126 / JCM 17055 / OF4) TaxID=398511 RepID=D3FYS5_ALKPO|nr:cold shock domain-containing protein [Alkalihalophilus pseudofirmus]ADC48958.1 DNA binding cold shock protein [Alkalihalophilus pseudofirmus OF4]
MNEIWKNDAETLEALAWIKPTGHVSKREGKKSKTEKPAQDRLAWFNTARGYGYTEKDVFIHRDSVISGEPRPGAAVTYELKETRKGKRGERVCVL